MHHLGLNKGMDKLNAGMPMKHVNQSASPKMAILPKRFGRIEYKHGQEKIIGTRVSSSLVFGAFSAFFDWINTPIF